MKDLYLTILHNTITTYLAEEKDKNKQPASIHIRLTPYIYKILHSEINTICKFDSEIPIEGIGINSLKMYGRTITITSDKELDEKFEVNLIKKLSELAVPIK